MAEIVERSASPSAVKYVQWGPVIGGAVTAAALAAVLHAFAGAIGLAVSSTAPTWRDASIALWILSGVCAENSNPDVLMVKTTENRS